MKPTRRQLLRSLLAMPIAATLDVEKLLWIPGQMIAVPKQLISIDIETRLFYIQKLYGGNSGGSKSELLLNFAEVSMEAWLKHAEGHRKFIK